MNVTVQVFSRQPMAEIPMIQTAILSTLKKAKLKPSRSKSPRILLVSFISEAQMKTTNRKFRKKNRPTDVLSFAQRDLPPEWRNPMMIGEIFLCLPYLRRQAKSNRVSVTEELVRLSIHGTLHLLGFDHEKSDGKAKKMFSLQESLVKKLVPGYRGATLELPQSGLAWRLSKTGTRSR